MALRAMLLVMLAALVAGCGSSQTGSLTEQGLLELRAGEYDRAIAHCSEALKIDPHDDQAFLYRGRAYYYRSAKGDLQRALADFAEAIRLEPKSADAYYFRAAVLRDLGEEQLAAADDVKARQLDEGLQNIIRTLPSQQMPTEEPPEPSADAPVAAGDGLPKSEAERREMFENLQQEFDPSAGSRRRAEAASRRASEATKERAERSRRSLYRDLEEPGESTWTTTSPAPPDRDLRAVRPVTPPGETAPSAAARSRATQPSPSSPFLPPGLNQLPPGGVSEAPYSQYPPPVRSPFAPRQMPAGAQPGGAAPANPFAPPGAALAPASPSPYRFSNPAVRPVNPRDYVP